VDTRSPEQRRRIMSAVGVRNTSAELGVRKLIRQLGYRFSLHAKALPGSPDIVFRKLRKVIFVHGCFWHGHRCRKGAPPKSRRKYWVPKIMSNKIRDRRNAMQLRAMGWKVLAVWQCQLRNPAKVAERMDEFLSATSRARPSRSGVGR
jgi:DNA mismatch endonuclease, patch repair protein